MDKGAEAMGVGAVGEVGNLAGQYSGGRRRMEVVGEVVEEVEGAVGEVEGLVEQDSLSSTKRNGHYRCYRPARPFRHLMNWSSNRLPAHSYRHLPGSRLIRSN